MVGTGVLRKDEDWGRHDQLLQFVEGYLFRLFPFPSNVLLGEVKQGVGMVGEVFDEPAVKVDKSNKRLNLLLVLWCWPFYYTRNLDQIHLHLAFQHNNSEVLYLPPLKLTFLRFEVHLVFPETFQHSPHDILMLRQHLSEYEDVVKVDADNPFHYHVSDDVIHHCLEGGRAVREAEEHDLWFKESAVCAEGGFPFISVADLYVVETPADIQFGEVSHTTELRDQFRDEWNWVPVLDCDCIQGSVVLYELE